jgi:hypothetical protein
MCLTRGVHRVEVKLRPLSGHTGVHLMNTSIHRAGLAIAALAVVTVVGGALIADGYLGARSQAAAGPASASVVAPAAAAAAETAPPQVVYVRPAPPPAVIHVTQTAPPARQRIVHVTVPGTGGENESEGGIESPGGDD